MNRQADPGLLAFIQAMPKAEIHVHLEGAIQPETVLALARRHRLVYLYRFSPLYPDLLDDF